MFRIDNGKKEYISPEVPENVEYFLCAFGIRVRYNDVTGKIEFTGTFNNVDFSTLTGDAIIPILRGMFIRVPERFKISKTDLEDAIRVTAMKYRYNPIHDYLKGCHSEYGHITGQLEMFFEQFIFDENLINKDFALLLFKKWLVGAAIMAFNNGRKSAQGVLVLKGSQGLGKTRFLKALLPEHLQEYVKEGAKIAKGTKDDRMQIMRKWFIELGELGSIITLQTVDSLKNIITESTDEIRKPYMKDIETVPRICSFLGTVNDDKFLKDDTGERRWWILPILGIKPLPKEFDINKMWGEIMELAFTQNYPYWLSREEIEQLNHNNMAFKSLSSEEQALKDLLDWSKPFSEWRQITATELCNEFEGKGRYNNSHMGRALRRLSQCGIEPYSHVVIPTNNMEKLYTIPPYKSYIADTITQDTKLDGNRPLNWTAKIQ